MSLISKAFAPDSIFGEGQADPAFTSLSAYFDGCRMKRNRCEYDFAGGVTETDADGLLKTVRKFAIDAEAWIKARHPSLA